MGILDQAMALGRRGVGALSNGASWAGQQASNAASSVGNWVNQGAQSLAQNSANAAATTPQPGGYMGNNIPRGVPSAPNPAPGWATGANPDLSVGANVAAPNDPAAARSSLRMDAGGRSPLYNPATEQGYLAPGSYSDVNTGQVQLGGLDQDGNPRPNLGDGQPTARVARPAGSLSGEAQAWLDSRPKTAASPTITEEAAARTAAGAGEAAGAGGKLRGVWGKVLGPAQAGGSLLGRGMAGAAGLGLGDMAQNGMTLGGLVNAGLTLGTPLGRRLLLSNPWTAGISAGMAPKDLGDDSLGKHIGVDASGNPLGYVATGDTGIGSTAQGGIGSPQMNGQKGPYPVPAAAAPATAPVSDPAAAAPAAAAATPPTAPEQQVYAVKGPDGSTTYTNQKGPGATPVNLQQPMVGRLEGADGVGPGGDFQPAAFARNSLSDPEAVARTAATQGQAAYVQNLRDQLQGTHLMGNRLHMMDAINGAGSNLANFTGQGVTRANAAEGNTVTAMNALRQYQLGRLRLQREYGNDAFDQLAKKQDMLDKEVTHSFPAKITGPDGKTQIDNPDVSNFYGFLGREGLDLRKVDPDQIQHAVADARGLYKQSNGYKDAAAHDSAIHAYMAKYGLASPIQQTDGPVHTVGVHKATVLEGLTPGSNISIGQGVLGQRMGVGSNGARVPLPQMAQDADVQQQTYDDLAEKIARLHHDDNTPYSDDEKLAEMKRIGLPPSAYTAFVNRYRQKQQSRGIQREGN